MISSAEPDEILDATGLTCPLPVLRARKKLSTMMSGQILQVIATDPMAVIDMPHFCAEAGHRLLAHEPTGSQHLFLIQRG